MDKDFNDLAQKKGGGAVLQALQSASRPQAFEWDEPEALPIGLLSVEPFDVDLLPDALRPWIQDIVERTQCPW